MNTDAIEKSDPKALNDFTEMIYKISDMEMIDAAEGLMNDLATINNMKQRIQMMEEKLHDGKRAAFYFFTLNLSDDEVALATQTVRGRKRVLTEKAAKLNKPVINSEDDNS